MKRLKNIDIDIDWFWVFVPRPGDYCVQLHQLRGYTDCGSYVNSHIYGFMPLVTEFET